MDYNLTTIFEKILQNSGIPAQHYKHAVQGMASHFDLMMKWNEKAGLTAVADPEEAAAKLYADSVLLLEYTRIPSQVKILDVGTGAGFPGLVLKIIRPDLSVSLLDSSRKKIDFLHAACASLKFKDVRILHGRAETLAHEPSLRETFDCVVAKALAPLPVAAELCFPFVKINGASIFLKGESINKTSELSEGKAVMKLLGAGAVEIHSYTLPALPELSRKRMLVAAKKSSSTPSKYPRKPGIPQKRPLMIT